MKRFIYVAIASLAALYGVANAASNQQKDPLSPEVSFGNVAVDRHDDEVEVRLTIDAGKLHPGKDREYTLTPTLYNPEGTDSVSLEPVTVAGRNLYFLHERHGDMAFEPIYRAGKVGVLSYSQRVAAPEWLDSARLVIDVRMRNCCNYYPLPKIPVGEIEQPKFVPIIDFGKPKNRIDSLRPKTRKIDGRAYINFPVNRIELYPDYMNNPAELKKIIGTIDSVKNDKDIQVDSIFIKGYASPEGSYANNVRLAKGRTATLKDYVEKMYTFPKDFIQTAFEPEDWEGLREYVMHSSIPYREEILAIIDSDLEPDPKNTAIQRRFPKEYAFLLATVYPSLRHSDYSIFYTIRTFTNPQEIISLTKTAPQKLSEEEVAFALSTLTPGSPESNDLYETAARIFPHNADFCMGAANAAIDREDFKGAENYLDRAGNTARVAYARGVIAASRGNLAEAKGFYEQAERMGDPLAGEALRELKESGDGKLRFVPAGSKDEIKLKN